MVHFQAHLSDNLSRNASSSKLTDRHKTRQCERSNYVMWSIASCSLTTILLLYYISYAMFRRLHNTKDNIIVHMMDQ